ncbi:MAG: helix-turn-helix transcriptional regulator [Treponema sp.]|nr:helix-turn-helix transcriptional regulator [Treponema sp.]MBQ8776271.1 helix-turn-helix transcriptional regulator [Treponema sp.]
MNRAVAQTIRELRRKKHISQEVLAEAIDSHQVYISEIENGKKQPSISVLHNIATYFGLSLSEFFAFIDEKL